jgi:hypothetical protein
MFSLVLPLLEIANREKREAKLIVIVCRPAKRGRGTFHLKFAQFDWSSLVLHLRSKQSNYDN